MYVYIYICGYVEREAMVSFIKPRTNSYGEFSEIKEPIAKISMWICFRNIIFLRIQSWIQIAQQVSAMIVIDSHSFLVIVANIQNGEHRKTNI